MDFNSRNLKVSSYIIFGSPLTVIFNKVFYTHTRQGIMLDSSGNTHSYHKYVPIHMGSKLKVMPNKTVCIWADA